MGVEIRQKSRPIKVANIIEEGKFGGPQMRMVMVSKAIQDQIDTTIIMPYQNSEKFREQCDINGVKYHLMSISRITKEWREALRYVFFSVFEIVNIYRFLKRGGFDLIHVSGGSWQFKGVLAGKLAGVKILWHMNDTQIPFLLKRLALLLAPLADGFIFASNRSKEYYNELLAGKGKAFTIPAPVDTTLFNPNLVVSNLTGELYSKLHNKTIVITVANINPIKGLDCFLRTAAEANKVSSEVYFIVIGEVYERQAGLFKELTLLAKELSVENVAFLGGRSDVKELLKMSDIYLCTSLAESSPISVWEAMAMGKPIVSTNVGDIPIYVTEGVNGYVVDVNDHAALSERILRYVFNKKNIKDHGINSRRAAVECLDIDFCVSRHVAAYSSFDNAHSERV